MFRLNQYFFLRKHFVHLTFKRLHYEKRNTEASQPFVFFNQQSVVVFFFLFLKYNATMLGLFFTFKNSLYRISKLLWGLLTSLYFKKSWNKSLVQSIWSESLREWPNVKFPGWLRASRNVFSMFDLSSW